MGESRAPKEEMVPQRDWKKLPKQERTAKVQPQAPAMFSLRSVSETFTEIIFCFIVSDHL